MKLNEFKKFILRGNVVDLAVGVVIGAAFNSVVQSLVKDMITPVISIFGGTGHFADAHFTIHGSQFLYGDFLNTLISFTVVAATVFFFVVQPINKLSELAMRGKAPTEPSMRKCPECLSKIPDEAKRCMYCTAVVGKKS